MATGLDVDGEFFGFTINTKSLYISFRRLKELNLPEGLDILDCSNNYLTNLDLPNGIKYIYCENNNLTSLIIPEGVKGLSSGKDLFDYDTCKVDSVNIYYT